MKIDLDILNNLLFSTDPITFIKAIQTLNDNTKSTLKDYEITRVLSNAIDYNPTITLEIVNNDKITLKELKKSAKIIDTKETFNTTKNSFKLEAQEGKKRSDSIAKTNIPNETHVDKLKKSRSSSIKDSNFVGG